MSSLFLTLLRNFFRILSAIAPRSAGHLAFWLFCRPTPARKVTPVQRSIAKDVEGLLPVARQQQIRFGSTDHFAEGTVNTYLFEPAGKNANSSPAINGTTLLLHGWSSRATHMLAFVEPLLAAGQRVIAVDFPAHGHSSGRSFHLPERTRYPAIRY